MPSKDYDPGTQSVIAGLSARAQQALGLPEGIDFYQAAPFDGMNQQDSPLAMPPSEMVLVENFIHTGAGALKAVWDAGQSIFNAPAGTSVVYMYFYALNESNKAAIFLSDGSAVEVDTDTLQSKQIGGPGKFYLASSARRPHCTTWSNLLLLIANNNTQNDYWIWDGNLLYEAGTASPNAQAGTNNGVVMAGIGSGYNTTPNITVSGGSGKDLALIPHISRGGVVSVDIANPGNQFVPGDLIQAIFSGGGSDTGAILQAQLVPVPVGSIEVTAQGSGYTTATVTVQSAGPTSLAKIVLTQYGLYAAVPYVTITGGGGSGAAAAAQGKWIYICWWTGFNWTCGYVFQVTGATVTAPGTGYASAPAIGFSGLVIPGHSGAAAYGILGESGATNATASATIEGGKITQITVTSGGLFTFRPYVSITGDGTGAEAVAILQPSSVQSIIIVNGGTGYQGPPGRQIPLLTAGFPPPDIYGFPKPNRQYFIIPTLTVAGGGGAGCVAEVTTVTSGVITAVKIDNAGFGYTSEPAVIVGPGANASALGFITLMPYGFSGNVAEIYNGMVWLANQALPATTGSQGNPQLNTAWGTLAATAPGTLWNTSITEGAFLFSSTEDTLKVKFTGLRSSQGYLYCFGDSSISVFSNVTTQPNTDTGIATTTGTFQTVDPQVGLAYRDALSDFGKVMIIMNQTGIFAVTGATANNISGKITNIFRTFVPPEQGGVEPSAASAYIHNIKHYLLCMTFKDPDSGSNVTKMVAFDGSHWSILSQSFNPTFIATQTIASQLSAWGTDGLTVRKMFSVPSSQLEKKIITKMYGGESMVISKSLSAVWLTGSDTSSSKEGIYGTISFDVSGQAPSETPGTEVAQTSGVGFSALNVQPSFSGPDGTWPVWGAGADGLNFNSISARITLNSPDFLLSNVILGYVKLGAFI
jgi:hypothetical protein